MEKDKHLRMISDKLFAAIGFLEDMKVDDIRLINALQLVKQADRELLVHLR